MFKNFGKPPLYQRPKAAMMAPLTAKVQIVKDPYEATRPQDILYPFDQKRVLTIKIPKSNFNIC
jgi:hypothetical protein